MFPDEKRDTHQKALTVNLDPSIFGSFAEIGAGQEVARWFFRVGGASGTVAKTISAYDKEVSNQLYGTGTRYVSKARLQAMLETEWAQLVGQLHATRGANTRFFSFVDTVSARNYAGTNDCHGWVGLRFQTKAGGPAHEIILHINLRDPTNARQQETVGILGVNLVHAVFYDLGSREGFLKSIFDDLGLDHVEIDSLECRGPDFQNWDPSEMQTLLVAGGYAEAIVFSPDHQVVPSNDLLYKRAVVLAPSGFADLSGRHGQLIDCALARLPAEELAESKGKLGLFCIYVGGANCENGMPSAKEIASQLKLLPQLTYGVMLFRARELYKMSAYVSRYTKAQIHFAVRLSVLLRVLNDRYKDLPGALLEGLARLFMQNVRVSVYPAEADAVRRQVELARLEGWKWEETNGMVAADDLYPPEPLDHLYRYLLRSAFIIPEKVAKYRTEVA